MNSFLNKKQFVSLLVLLGLVLVLPLALLLTRQRQEVRKKAAGTGVIQVKLTPASTTKQPGDTSPVALTATLTNISGDTASIRVAGVEFNFNQNALDITNINCGSSLSSAAFRDVVGNKVRLVCYVPPGETGPSAPLTIAAGASVDLGGFQASLKADATAGTYTFSPRPSDGGRTNIPEEGTLRDLSDEGTPATIIVEGEVTVTPTPTPTGVATPTPIPTVPPGECPNGDKGNLNCDAQALINEGDLGILIFKWSPSGPVPTPNPDQRSADIQGTNGPDGDVDEGDLGKLLFNWKTE